jgi:hypothetical protein
MRIYQHGPEEVICYKIITLGRLVVVSTDRPGLARGLVDRLESLLTPSGSKEPHQVGFGTPKET